MVCLPMHLVDLYGKMSLSRYVMHGSYVISGVQSLPKKRHGIFWFPMKKVSVLMKIYEGN